MVSASPPSDSEAKSSAAYLKESRVVTKPGLEYINYTLKNVLISAKPVPGMSLRGAILPYVHGSGDLCEGSSGSLLFNNDIPVKA